MTMHTIFLVEHEQQSANRDEAIIHSYPMDGPLSETLPLASAVVTNATPRRMRIVAAIEVDPARGLDTYFASSRALRRASGTLELDQFIWVSPEGAVHHRRTELPLAAKSAWSGTAGA